MTLVAAPCPLPAAALSDPAVDAFNIRMGTQTFGPRYRFTTNTVLVETAEAIRGMGSDVIKFYLGKGLAGQYPGLSVPSSATNLATLAQHEPSCRRVLDMPFRHFLIWSYCFAATGDAGWSDGFSSGERQKEYNEIYAFARHLLTQYNNTGKSFYLGHWEGDWYLLPGYNTSVNPTPVAIQGMIDWLNTRQQAVDDALRDVPHTNVAVYHYTEANRVRDAMNNGPANNQRLVNKVLPYVTNIDFVSWSSYDGMDLATPELHATLDYLEAHLPTNKAAAISGRRVIVGEYGWGGSKTSVEQELPTRTYLRRLLPWSPRFILFWEMYDNENKAFWLIDSAGNRTPCYFLHQRLANHARLAVARFQERQGRLPGDAEFAALVTPALENPLPAPTPLAWSRPEVLSLTGTVATVTGTLTQGVYGDEEASVWVFWGTEDGGTVQSSWANAQPVGINRHFNPTPFVASLTNLVPGTNVFFRYYATNATGEAWATNSVRFDVTAIDPADFGSRLGLTLAGYTRGEPLEGFPVLVKLGGHVPGFDYRHFASPTGGDLRFANASGTVLVPHEVDEWNTNGTSWVWVRAPSLTGPDDALWAYWGNPRATNPPATSTNGAVWSEGFELVWHLKESAFPRADSTTRHPARGGGNPGTTAAGAVGRAVVFDGTSSYLNAGLVDLGEAFTLSAWIKPDSTANSIQAIWANKPGGSIPDGFAFFLNSWQTRDQRLLFETGDGVAGAVASTATNVVSSGAWHHVAAVVDRVAGFARLFVDGTERTATPTVLPGFATHASTFLGRFSDGLYTFKGPMDEVRIEQRARSADWLWASWMNVVSNADFVVQGSVARRAPILDCRVNGGAARLVWPAHAVGFDLWTATNLSPPATWLKVTNMATLTEAGWQLDLPVLEETESYYRLQAL